MHYIKDIFEGKNTEHAHQKLIRYSKGEFVGPAIKAKFDKTSVKISSSFHLVDEFLVLLVDILKEKIVHISGSVVWNKDLSDEFAKLGIRYSKVTKSRGIFKYVLENDVNFKDFVTYFGRFNLLLSVKDGDVSFVTKSNFPKPNKEVAEDFCKLVLPVSLASKVRSEFFFDVPDKTLKEVSVRNLIVVENIDLPKDISSFDEARRLAKREGHIKRIISIGEQKIETLSKFSV